MAYSYSTPLTYGPQTELAYYDTAHKKSSSASATVVSAIAGGGVGAYMGYRKSPTISKSGEISDAFVKQAFENYINKSADSGKEAYNEGLNILKKIDSVKTPEELKSLMDANKEAAKEFCAEMKQTPEEFLSNVTSDNLKDNKKVIKEKITAGNNTRYQNVKNQIQACWDKDSKKFVKKDSVKDDIYEVIKKSNSGMKGKTIAKYTAIGVGVAGLVGYIVSKFISR